MLEKNVIPHIKSHILKDHSHGFFTRQGGVSTGLLHSLNMSFREEDTVDNVLENRSRALKALTLSDSSLLTLRQVHGSHVIHAQETWALEDRPEGDALVTTNPDLTLGIQTADCVPILLADRRAGVIGAIHAGWRSAHKGIIKNTLDTMKGLGATHIEAAIGPCISQENYEVGQELFQQFKDLNPQYETFFHTQEFPEALFFDLPGLVAHQLKCQGVAEVERLPYDTYEHEDLFFSCRRAQHEKEPTFGGHLSLISLKKVHEHI